MGNKKKKGKNQPDYDSPWKKALERFFPKFMQFYFPALYDKIEWAKGHEFKNTELQKAFVESKVGRRYADCLVKVHRKNETAIWLLVHVEIQSNWTKAFTERMYVYRHRIWEMNKVDVLSLAVLCDQSPKRKTKQNPGLYQVKIWDCKLDFEFPTVRLLDYADDWDQLEKNLNPFAIVTMAQIKAKYVKDGPERKRWKFYLTKMLYERHYSKDDIIQLFQYLDWMIQLPLELAEQFNQEHNELEQEKTMEYVTQGEQIKFNAGVQAGIQQGVQQGVQQGMHQVLFLLMEAKFGEIDPASREKIESADAETIQRWSKNILDASTLDAVFQ